jgi:hypothetical protein
MSDARTAERKAIKRTVHVATGLGPPMNCTLKDISKTGARLEVIDANTASQEFLIILNDGLLRWCQTIWRGENEIGVRFIGIPKSLTRTG